MGQTCVPCLLAEHFQDLRIRLLHPQINRGIIEYFWYSGPCRGSVGKKPSLSFVSFTYRLGTVFLQRVHDPQSMTYAALVRS